MQMTTVGAAARNLTPEYRENEEGGWTAFYGKFEQHGHTEFVGDGPTKAEAAANLAELIADMAMCGLLL